MKIKTKGLRDQKDKRIIGQKVKKPFNLLIFLFTFLSLNLFIFLSDISLFAGTATTSADFLRENLSARQVGMGGIFAAIPDDSYSIQSNPSGLSLLTRPEIGMGYAFTQDFSRHGFLAYAHPIINTPLFQFTGGTGISYFSAGNIDITSPDETTTSSFKAEVGYSGIISAAVRFQKWLAIGVSPKYVRSTLVEQFTASAFAVDFGIMIFPMPELFKERVTIGTAVQNLGQKISYKRVEHDLPRTNSAGIAVQFWDNEEYGSVLCSGQAEQVQGEKIRYRIGGEYSFGKKTDERSFAIRGGMRIHFDSEDYSMGIGLREKNIQLDYAFVNSIDLEKTHRFSLSFLFGKFKEKKETIRYELLQIEKEMKQEENKELDIKEIEKDSESVIIDEKREGSEKYYLMERLKNKK